MPVSVKAGGAWKSLNKAFVKVGGAWKEAQVYVKAGGVWKRASASPLTIYANVNDVWDPVKLYVNGVHVHTFTSAASSFTVYSGDNVYVTFDFANSPAEFNFVSLTNADGLVKYATADTDYGPYGAEGLQTPTIQATVDMRVMAQGWNY